MPETTLTLIPARKSRGGDHWDRDDYDARHNGRVIGRRMLRPQAPERARWFWIIVQGTFQNF